MQLLKPLLFAQLLLVAVISSAVSQTPRPNAPANSPDKSRARSDSTGRVILITGSTDGLGRDVAIKLAASGAHIIVHGRNRERGLAVVDEIKRQGKGSAAFYPSDFASLENVRAFADTILHHYSHIDVLINNAGVWLREGPRQASADGYEMTFAVNYLAGFQLTRLLLPRLIASAPSRIINVASQTQSPINFNDVMQEQNYIGQRAYSQSKLAQVMFTFDLARELEGKRVTVVALHPATLMDTHLVQAAGVQPKSTVDEGAAALLHVVNDAAIVSGKFYIGMYEGRANAQAYDESARAELRAVSDKLIKKRR